MKKVCILLLLLTYVYHDAHFRKRKVHGAVPPLSPLCLTTPLHLLLFHIPLLCTKPSLKPNVMGEGAENPILIRLSQAFKYLTLFLCVAQDTTNIVSHISYVTDWTNVQVECTIIDKLSAPIGLLSVTKNMWGHFGCLLASFTLRTAHQPQFKQMSF
jgi:hypothetical protein